MEKRAHEKIRALYKHNLFQPVLPVEQMLGGHLTDRSMWKVLGLSPGQLAAMAGAAGAAVGAVADTAAAGLTFGVFTSIGAAVGAGSALFGGGKIASAKVKGLHLGGWEIQMGPVQNPQLFFVALDRSLIFYHRVINWAHGRRDFNSASQLEEAGPVLTKDWRSGEKAVCRRFFASRTSASSDSDTLSVEMTALLENRMLEMAGA